MTTPFKDPFAFTRKQPIIKTNGLGQKAGGPMVIGGNKDKQQTEQSFFNQFGGEK